MRDKVSNHPKLKILTPKTNASKIANSSDDDQLFICMPSRRESLKLTGLGVLPARAITIGQLNLLCLGNRTIVYANTLMFTDAWFYLKDYSLFWNRWLILVKRLTPVFILVVMCMVFSLLHSIFGQNFVHYWFQAIYFWLWLTQSQFLSYVSK